MAVNAPLPLLAGILWLRACFPPLPLSILYVRLSRGPLGSDLPGELPFRQIGDVLNRKIFSAESRQPDPPGNEPEWICVATAPDQLLAEMWQEVLREASIPSMLAPQDTISFLGVATTPVRIMVPRAMSAQAEEILKNLSGDGQGSSQPEEDR